MGTSLVRRYVYLDKNNPTHLRILAQIDRQSNKSAYIAHALERVMGESNLLENIREIIQDELQGLKIVGDKQVEGETDKDNDWLSDLAL